MSQEQAELEAYRQAVAAAAEAKAAAAAAAEAGGLDALAEPSCRDSEEAAPGPGPGSSSGGTGAAAGGRKLPISSKAASKPLLPVLKPVVRVKPKGGAAGGEGSAAGADQRDNKRPKLGDGAEKQQPASVGLEGLLGGYASDSE